MKSNDLLFFLPVLVWLLTYCSSDKKVDQQAVKEELKKREIKKIPEAEIIKKVYDIGEEIASNAQKTLAKNLKSAIVSGGVENAISFCNIKAMPLIDSLSKQYGAEIKRVSMKYRNPNDKPNELEQEILEAYAAQLKDSTSLKTNVQVLDDNSFLFTKPIMITNPLCLNCHGMESNGLTKETRDFILTKYPDDKATGYKLGELRGMWSITIPKKKVVLSM